MSRSSGRARWLRTRSAGHAFGRRGAEATSTISRPVRRPCYRVGGMPGCWRCRDRFRTATVAAGAARPVELEGELAQPEVPTTPPRPVDVEEAIPELRQYAATATRLHPRPGNP